ncbi:pyridoxamine 5-phosphate oxidase [Candidatus Photodesmus blepharus]|uniref:Pyridoxamine 5-phosphate oxidase n=1 Tax=Candidatus Photodesmus blepharonis TaxID=1179155 RepID=A0A084CND0_9GAMM|nr:DUF3283 family protein [Candidatus Photodesmus blepharus]KEY91309.1 pyridoxamine 5-phosphate oxidase [Candidatus Photodesmus blepharus]
MSFNLSLLPENEKKKIELDKQASFLVWQLLETKIHPEEIVDQIAKVVDEEEKVWFEKSIAKYKKMMGLQC